MIPRNPSAITRVKSIEFPILVVTSFLSVIVHFLSRRALAMLALGTGLIAVSPSHVFADGRIVAGHDVNTLATARAGDLEETFAINVARWLVGADTGALLLFEPSATDPERDYAASVEQALMDAGFEVTVTDDIDDPDISNLAVFDAVFVGVSWIPGLDLIDPQALIDYVQNGGNVYVFGGVGGGAANEASVLNAFIQNFGLAFLPVNNLIFEVLIDSTHPIFTGITGQSLMSGNGSNIGLCNDPSAPIGCISNDNAEIVQFAERPPGTFQGVYAVVAAGPTANAGPDQPVDEGTKVTLDGSGSSDPEGDPLNYTWSQPAGPIVMLDLTDPVHPMFDAPLVDENTTLTFELVVDDGVDVSAPDTVDITVVSINSPPVADAGDDFSIKPGAVTTLDGSNSFDPDGTPLIDLTFEWTQVAGITVVVLDVTDPIRPTFVVPNDVGDTLVFKLKVSDGLEMSTPSSGADSAQPDTVAVTIVDNAPPNADAGSNQTKFEGETVTLDGSESNDPDGDALTFEWNQIAGTDVGIDGAATAIVSFEAPLVGPGGEDLVFKLTVDDNDPVNSLSDMDEVTITVKSANDPPSCGLARPSVDTLWPPNHKMVQIAIDGVTDPDSPLNLVSITITAITQDEPVNGLGDGDSSPDGAVQIMDPADALLLRAERAGTGNGRVYVVSFRASDGFDSCDGSVSVTVPHSRKAVAVDDGQFFNSELE